MRPRRVGHPHRRAVHPGRGEIVHLTDPLIQPAGGGAVTAAALVRMGAAVQFFTAAGDDVPVAEAMEELGVRTYAAPRPGRHTRTLVMRDPAASARSA